MQILYLRLRGSTPSSLGLAQHTVPSLPSNGEKRESHSRRHSLDSEHPHLGHHWHSTGRSPGARLITSLSASAQKECSPTQRSRSLYCQNANGSSSSSSCRICSRCRLIPSQASRLDSSELWELSMTGQTSPFSIIKFTDPVTQFIFQPKIYILTLIKD